MTDRLGADVPDWLCVSRETREALDSFVAMVRKWTPTINLVSKPSLPDLWQRHVLDSAQLFSLAAGRGGHWADLGSGGGFPGVVIAILAKERVPAFRVTLVESDQRKATFLSQVVRVLGLPALVRAERSEAIEPLQADIVSARALAGLDVLCGHADRHLRRDGLALFPKGAQAEQEIAAARKHWQFEVTRHPSHTDPDATLLAIKDISHV